MNPKDIISQKVEDFAKNEKVYKSKDFQETETRTRFIDPFFEALGWNLNQTNIPKNQWDVHREYSQKDNSSTKKPDYAFRIESKLKFFVEAKAPHVALTDKDPVFQAKRYAYSTAGKAPIIILTDFEEFRVFNALQRPIYENPMQGVIKEFDFTYKDYVKKWDLLYNTFSREAVASGSLDRLVGKIAKKTKKLDDEFLEQIIGWRENLAKSLAMRNDSLSVDEINEAVQRILDRIIFIRQLEDRNIVEENTLFDYTKNKDNLYKSLIPFFSTLNVSYNGLLFKPHFSEKLVVEDKVIKEIVLDLCYPRSPFQFDVIEPEILGRIYERFLGSKIRLTESHRAKVEEKPEVRHAGGVYYTPEYIVNYIVQETVGKKLSNQTPEEASKLKIVDPACGSGSFLLGAYQYLIDWHVAYYKSKVVVHRKAVAQTFLSVENKEKSIDNKSKPSTISTQAGMPVLPSKKYKDEFYFDSDGNVKLTVKKKGEILVNNIFGVDIDREATEVAIMSLYLKLLEEGLGDDTYLFLKGKVLPDMSNNIKCGNSLISRDDLYKNNMFGGSNIQGFDWNPNSFDIVIGNPPYVRIQEMQKWAKDEVELYKKIYESGSSGNFDIYILFIEKALSLLNENGIIGYICPHKFFNSNYGKNIRDIIYEKKSLQSIVHFGINQIFENATTYTCLLFLGKTKNESFNYFEFKDEIKNIQELVESGINYFQVDNSKMNQDNWVFVNSENSNYLNKMCKGKSLLEDITTNIFQGPKAGADPVFIIECLKRENKTSICYSKTLDKEFKIENSIIKPYVKGKFIRRYFIERNQEYIIFPYSEKGKLIIEKELKDKFPLAYEYLSTKENKKILLDRENGRFKNIWWSYSRPQNMQILNTFKLLTPFNAFNSSFALDDNGDFIFSAGVSGAYGILLKKEVTISYNFLLGILNSKPIEKYLKAISTALRGAYYSYENKYIRKLPIYIPDPLDKDKYPLTLKVEELVKQILEIRRRNKNVETGRDLSVSTEADAEFLEKKIDEIVEKLYEV